MSKYYMDPECSCQGKYLDKMLQPNILLVLYKEPMHGFKLIQELSRSPMFSDSTPDRTGVYRYLKRMEEDGLLDSREEIEEESGRHRRIYSITEKGERCLSSWKTSLKQYLVTMIQFVRELDESV